MAVEVTPNHLLGSAMLHWIEQYAPHGILITDVEFIICGWNQWLENHTGKRAIEVMGRNLFEVFPDIATRNIDRYYQDALHGQVRILSQRFHKFLLPATGGGRLQKDVQQSARISPLSAGNGIIGTVTFIEDVTERVARESELQAQIDNGEMLLEREQAARAEAEEANRLKDEFLATVSHELRTPLTAILGWSRMLKDGQLNQGDAARAIDTIERNARAQSQLIEDILDVSRIISGKVRLANLPVSPATVIEAAVEAVRLAAEVKEIRLDIQYDRSMALVSGDQDRLQQVVWNLLSNAIKFTQRGGRVMVRLSHDESQVQIVVSDNGQGIPPEVLPHIFERFRQADSSMTRSHGGLGLGLAIVRHFVELHGGTIEAESKGLNQGATFTISLPIISDYTGESPVFPTEERVPLGHSEIPLECTDQLQGVHVLVVEDEEDSRSLITSVLSKCGAKVTTADSATEGFSALESLRPDVLISDLGMPGQDGYSLISKVRALPPEKGGATPAAALTAYARVEDRMRVLRSGFQIHVPKPIEPAELVTVVANLARRY